MTTYRQNKGLGKFVAKELTKTNAHDNCPDCFVGPKGNKYKTRFADKYQLPNCAKLVRAYPQLATVINTS